MVGQETANTDRIMKVCQTCGEDDKRGTCEMSDSKFGQGEDDNDHSFTQLSVHTAPARVPGPRPIPCLAKSSQHAQTMCLGEPVQISCHLKCSGPVRGLETEMWFTYVQECRWSTASCVVSSASTSSWS